MITAGHLFAAAAFVLGWRALSLVADWQYKHTVRWGQLDQRVEGLAKHIHDANQRITAVDEAGGELADRVVKLENRTLK